MTKQQKTEKTPTDTEIVTPNLTLNANDKIYLATGQKTENMLHFIYTVFCRRNPDSNSYNISAETDIATFKNADDANVYVATVKQIAAYQKHTLQQGYTTLVSLNRPLISKLEEHTR